MKTLYQSLVEDGLVAPDESSPVSTPETEPLTALTGRAFSEAVLRSEEFRLYIVEGLTERNLPPAVLCRLMDHGWGKPPERVEHTGRDGAPIVTEVRRVVVRAPAFDAYDQLDARPEASKVTH